MKQKVHTKIDRLFTIILFLSVSLAAFSQTDLEVLSMDPTPNTIGVDRSTNIGLTFDQNIDPTTLNTDHVKINGNYGLFSGFPAPSVNGNLAILNMDRDFFPGETISVTLTKGITNQMGASLTKPFTYRFNVGVSPDSPGEFPNGTNIVYPGGIRSLSRNSATPVDMDGDGDLDLLAPHADNGGAVWYENPGDGRFVSHRIIKTSDPVISKMVPSDMDGDGDLDFLAINVFSTAVTLFQNDGNGNFLSGPQISSDSRFRDLAVGDFDSDGDLDMIAINGNSITSVTNATASNGQGTISREVFGAKRTVTTQVAGGQEVACADLDGDGDLDVVSTSADDNKIAWYENDGNGIFGAQKIITQTAVGARNIFISDLNGDRILDIVSTTTGDNRISWFPNLGGGNFDSPRTITLAVNGIEDIDAADMDGDGDLDVLSASNNDNKVAWYPNDGNGNFGDQIIISPEKRGASYVWVATGDLDGDGDLDVVSAISDRGIIEWYENTGSVPLSAKCVAPFSIPLNADGTAHITVADMDDGSSGFTDMEIDIADFDCSHLGANSVTLTVTNATGSTESCTTTVTLVDSTAPIADSSALPEVMGECRAHIALVPTATDSCGGTITATTTDPLTYEEQGTFTVTWTYDDGNGNTSTQEQNVVVEDVSPPLPDMAALPDVTGECKATVLVAPTASDNCKGAVTATTTDPLSYEEQGTYTVIWTYDDGNGNTSTQQQIVIVEDTEAPIPDMAILEEVAGECQVAVEEVPTATDGCGGTINATTNDPLEYDRQGSYTLTWTYDDGNGNTSTQQQTVIVEDTEAPIPDRAVLEDVIGECQIAVEEVPTATDGCGATITATTNDPLEYDRQGSYTLTWTYDDGNGNTSTQQQTVIVENAQAPIPDRAVLEDVIGECQATVEEVPTATDGCGATITATTNDPLEYDRQGTYTVNWTYDDGNGNISSQTQQVIVENSMTGLTPDRAVLPDVRGECEATILWVPTATDSCGGTFTAKTNDPITYNEQGTYTVTWSYDTGNGNIITQQQRVVVEDLTPPTAMAKNISVALDENGQVQLAAEDIDNGSADNCGISDLSLDTMLFDCPELGNTTVELTVTDTNGNSSSATATVTFTAPDNNSDGVADTCGPELKIVPLSGISPNEDGINDTWVIENITDFPQALIKVFDIRGKEVFSTHNYRNDWRGTDKTGSNLLPVGSYYYIIRLQRPQIRNISGWLYINY